MAERKKLDIKEILLPALCLFTICFVVAGVLAGMNLLTKKPIETNALDAANAARAAIFPGARFEAHGAYFTAIDENGALLGYCIDSEAQGYGGLWRADSSYCGAGR